MKRKVLVYTAIAVVSVLISIPVSYVNATEQNWSQVVYPGVYIEDLDVSGKQLSEVRQLVYEKYEKALLSKKIEIQVMDKTYVLDYVKLQAGYNAEAVAKEAFSYGKDENIIKRYRLIKFAGKKTFNLNFSYDSKLVEDTIELIDKENSREPIDAKISIDKGEVKISSQISGVRLEKDKLKLAILEQINEKPSVEAVKITAALEELPPRITSEKLTPVNSKVASFATNFSGSTAERINNISLATSAINGTLLMPGEVFSFNKIVGERSIERGYKEAGVIKGDKIESGLGGGICQVSSTLYNAVLKSSLKAFERRNHTLPLAYVGKGLDATVDYGSIDLKFKNTLEVPVYIEGYVQKKNVYFNIYSNNAVTQKTYQLETEVTETIEPTTKYIDDPKRPIGETEVVKKPAQGYKVKTYRKTFENDQLVKTELISSDYYRPVNGEIIRGTKKVSK